MRMAEGKALQNLVQVALRKGRIKTQDWTNEAEQSQVNSRSMYLDQFCVEAFARVHVRFEVLIEKFKDQVQSRMAVNDIKQSVCFWCWSGLPPPQETQMYSHT